MGDHPANGSGPGWITLADGRHLGYHEFGDPAGKPCLYVPGSPSSGLLGAVFDRTARETGVRWVAVDKPGFGASDHDPDLSLPRTAADIKQLADHLGLGRWAVAGESGGGPHALAVAHLLGERVTTCLVLSGVGPPHAQSAGDRVNPANRRMTALARHAPWLLRAQMSLLDRMLKDPVGAKQWEHAIRESAPEVDRRAWERFDSSSMLPAAQDAFRSGERSAAQELTVLVRPWGFALETITCPVEFWHGAADENVPVGVARRVAAEIPGSRTRIVEDAGHCLAPVRQQDVMTAVLAAD